MTVKGPDTLSMELTIKYEEFEDTKGVIRIRKSKRDRQHNGQKKKGHITHKAKVRVTRTSLKSFMETRERAICVDNYR